MTGLVWLVAIPAGMTLIGGYVHRLNQEHDGKPAKVRVLLFAVVLIWAALYLIGELLGN